MTTICRYCNALKFKRETAGLCCASGKVKLDPLLTPPSTRTIVFINFWDISNVEALLSHTQNCNSTFEMTSFGATKIIRDNFMPTFKVNNSTKLSHVYINLNHKVFDTFKN